MRLAKRLTLAILLPFVLAPCMQGQQLQLSLTLSPKPSPYLSEWQTRRETAILTITNPGSSSITAKIRAKISLDGALRAETRDESMPVLELSPGLNTYYADQIIPSDAVRFKGGIEVTAVRTGMLPAGMYELCVEVVSITDGRPLTRSACKQFSITSYQNPVLQWPENGSQVTPDKQATFRWTPVIPQPAGGVKYVFRLFELQQGQTASNVLLSGVPLDEREVLSQTQLMWPQELVLPEGARTYAWSVRAVDQNGNPLGEHDGWAAPFTFSSGMNLRMASAGTSQTGGLVLEGTVKDFETNLPISGAEVTYHPVNREFVKPNLSGPQGTRDGFRYIETADSLSTVTDANGVFRFNNAKDDTYFYLSGTAPGFQDPGVNRQIEYQESDIQEYLLLLKSSPGHLAGKVVDSLSGKHLNNIIVELWRDGGSRSGGGGLQPSPGSGETGSGARAKVLIATDLTEPEANSSSQNQGKTQGKVEAAGGRFRFDDIGKGDGFSIAVNQARYRSFSAPVIPTFPGKSKGLASGEVIIRLQPETGTIEGWVREDSTRYPIPGATVYLYSDVGVSVALSPQSGGDQPGQQDSGWNPGAGSTPSAGAYAQYTDAHDKNIPFTPDQAGSGSNQTQGGPPTGAGTQSGQTSGQTGAAVQAVSQKPASGQTVSQAGVSSQWSANSAWSASSGTPDGGIAPVFKPDSLPLVDPVVTDKNGYFVIHNVRINDPSQTTDKFAVWARKQGYFDALSNVRLAQDGETVSARLTMRKSRGIVYGKITGDLNDEPLGDVKIWLLVGTTDIVKTAYSNPDGTYTLYDIPDGAYNLVFMKSGLQAAFVPAVIIENGTLLRLDKKLKFLTAVVKGIVTNNKDFPLSGVQIHSPTAGHISAVSMGDGTFLIPKVPLGETVLSFTYPNLVDKEYKITIEEECDTNITVKMDSCTGSITLQILDFVTKDPIPKASVTLYGSKKTNGSGIVKFIHIPVGVKSIFIVSDTASGKDYQTHTGSGLIAKDQHPIVTIYLRPAARISGTVTSPVNPTFKLDPGDLPTGRPPVVPVDSARISIEGVPGVSAITDADGNFTLRNVPADVQLTLRAVKVSYKVGKVEVTNPLSAGEHRTGIPISMEVIPVLSMYGFKTEIDNITESGGKTFVSGSVVSIPENLFLETKKSDARLPFTNVEVDDDFKPVADSIRLSVNEVDIKLFQMAATMRDDSGIVVGWTSGSTVGRISGKDIYFDAGIGNKFPYSSWIQEKLSWPHDSIPGFYSDGVFRGRILGMNIRAGQGYVHKFWGFELTVDYTRSKISSDGLHYYGTLKIPGLDPLIIFEDLHIEVPLKDGWIPDPEFKGVTIKTDPPIAFDFGAFKVVDSSTTWDETGLRAGGMVEVTMMGGQQFGFHDLWISKEGDFNNIVIDLPDDANMELFGATLQAETINFGITSDESSGERTRYLVFSGKLTIDKLDNPIEFQDLKLTDDGEFTGTIQFNQSFTFANIVGVSLQSVEFAKDNNEQRYIHVKGGVAFNIPCLSVQVGNFKFWENGSLTVEQIGFSFTAQAVEVELTASYSNNVFEGSGSLIVRPSPGLAPVLNVSGAFRYGGSQDWWIKISANVPPIPIGPFTIVAIRGELGRQSNSWTFGVGGDVTVGSEEAKKAILLKLDVSVTTTQNGPIIQGNADVIVMSNLQVGHASVTLDYGSERFYGSLELSWNKKSVEVHGWVNLEVKKGQYWYVGAGLTVNLFKMGQIDASVYIGRNYAGNLHSFPVAFHPNNTPINGFHLDAEGSSGVSKSMYTLSVNNWMYAAMDYDLGLSGGFKLRVVAACDLLIAHGNGEVNIEAAISYADERLRFHGYADVSMMVWVWPCKKDSKCKKWCKVCINVSINADYDSVSGWAITASW